jgi:Macrocin-O-methyltransferase (TylF)
MIEAGCALGGSALVMARAKSRARPLYLHDVFGMIPPPTEEDGERVAARYREIVEGVSEGIGDDVYYGYQPDLERSIRRSFQRHGMPVERSRVTLVKGLFEDTLRPTEPVALAHLDCDWYESVTTCLERIVPLLVPGGVLVVDDYWTWDGARRAVDEFFAGRDRDFEFVEASRLHIVRST